MRKTVCGILLMAAGSAFGQAPAITASGTTFSFTSTPIYVTNLAPSPTTITLTNSGTAALLISGIAKTGTHGGDFDLSGSCVDPKATVTVNANATCTITARFTPAASGSRSATLTVVSNAASNPSITVSGTATIPNAPSFVLGMTDLVFNSTTVATPSAARRITVINNSSQMVTISDVTVTSTQNEFAQTNDCLNNALDKEAFCGIDVTFTPAQAGKSTGTITITSNASGSPHRITLSGPGVAVATGAATLAASKLSFPSTPTGTTATILRTTLTNTGNAPLKIDPAAMISGTNKDEFKVRADSSCLTVGTLLTDDPPCDLEVDFTPAATGARSGSLDVTHDGVGGKSTVALDGTGVTPPPPPTPPAPTTPAPTTPSGSSAQSPGGGGAIDLAALLLLAPVVLLGRSRRRRDA